MRQLSELLALPSSLLLTLLVLQWRTVTADRLPNLSPSLPPHSSQHVHIVRRNAEIQRRLAIQAPAGVRKMSGDATEMFFPEYWHFGSDEGEEQPQSAQHPQQIERLFYSSVESPNTTVPMPYLPPFLLHSNGLSHIPLDFRNSPRHIFDKRAFQCPTGTNSCSFIGQPNSCCPTDDTCVLVTNSNVGPVGCCPADQTCGGQVEGCDTTQGYTSCPGSPNGGCCIPNYSCEDVGCVAESTTTVVTTLPITTVSQAPPTTSLVIVTAVVSISIATTIIPTTLAGSVVVETATILTTITPPISTTTVPELITVQDTPVAPSTITSVTTLVTTSTTISIVYVAPVRPTSDTTDTTDVVTTTTTTTVADVTVGGGIGQGAATTTTTLLTTSTADICPTGFYPCSAYYVSAGCCRTGQNCDSTSCPSVTPTSLVTDSVVTIVALSGVVFDTSTTTLVIGGTTAADGVTVAGVAAPASTTTVLAGAGTTTVGAVVSAVGAAAQGSCATGWFACGAAQGDGCCPLGYVCGASCTNTAAAGPGMVGRIPEAGAGMVRLCAGLMVGFAVVAGVGMVVL